MLVTRTQIPIWIVSCLLAAGCDPVRTSSQVVRLQIVESASGQPLRGKKVSLKYDYLTAAGPLPPKEWKETMSPEEWDKYRHRQAIQGYEWFDSSTDERGQADFGIEFTSIDRFRGSTPPPEADSVTGEPYLIRVKEGELVEEELSVVMQRGASVKGKIYTVTVIDIKEPRYVPNADWEDTLKE